MRQTFSIAVFMLLSPAVLPAHILFTAVRTGSAPISAFDNARRAPCCSLANGDNFDGYPGVTGHHRQPCEQLSIQYSDMILNRRSTERIASPAGIQRKYPLFHSSEKMFFAALLNVPVTVVTNKRQNKVKIYLVLTAVFFINACGMSGENFVIDAHWWLIKSVDGMNGNRGGVRHYDRELFANPAPKNVLAMCWEYCTGEYSFRSEWQSLADIALLTRHSDELLAMSAVDRRYDKVTPAHNNSGYMKAENSGFTHFIFIRSYTEASDGTASIFAAFVSETPAADIGDVADRTIRFALPSELFIALMALRHFIFTSDIQGDLEKPGIGIFRTVLITVLHQFEEKIRYMGRAAMIICTVPGSRDNSYFTISF